MAVKNLTQKKTFAFLKTKVTKDAHQNRKAESR